MKQEAIISQVEGRKIVKVSVKIIDEDEEHGLPVPKMQEYSVVDEVERLAEEYLKVVGTHDRPDITKHDFIQGFTQSNSRTPFSEKFVVGFMNFLSDGVWVGNKTTGKWEQYFNQEIELLPDQLFQLYLDSLQPKLGEKIQVEIVDGKAKIAR